MQAHGCTSMPPAECQVAWCNLPCRPSVQQSSRGAELCPQLPGARPARCQPGAIPNTDIAPRWRLAGCGQEPAPGPSGLRHWWGQKNISAFREMSFDVGASQPCVHDGRGEEVKEGTHQGVTLFTKPRGRFLSPCAGTAAQRFPNIHPHTCQWKCLLNMNCKLSVFCNVPGWFVVEKKTTYRHSALSSPWLQTSARLFEVVIIILCACLFCPLPSFLPYLMSSYRFFLATN